MRQQGVFLLGAAVRVGGGSGRLVRVRAGGGEPIQITKLHARGLMSVPKDLTGGAADYNQDQHYGEVEETSRGMKMAAVALATVFGFVPVFSQVIYAQAAPVQHIPPVLPIGEELDDVALANVDGEVGMVFCWILLRWVPKAVKAIIATTTMAVTAIQEGCSRLAQQAAALQRAIDRAALRLAVRAELTINRCLSFTSAHPLATGITLGGVSGGLHGGLSSDAPTTAGRLRDAAGEAFFGASIGAIGGVLTLPGLRLRGR